jgi:hypothetical protein
VTKSGTGPGAGPLRPPSSPPGDSGATQPAGRELFARHARKDGREVAILKAIDYGDSCVVEAEVYPPGAASAGPTRPGPYTFGSAGEATAFVTEAVEALMYLGCDVQAQ